MVLVTLLTGADAAMEGADTLIVEGRVVSEDEEDNEDGFNIEGGHAPAAVTREVELVC